MISRALISVSDKTGLKELAQFLMEAKVEILSSGGTAQFLRENHIPVVEVSAFTGAEELFDGRVKTLHPKIHGGILSLRNNPKHLAEMKKHQMVPIDLVVVNLYPFEKTVTKQNVPEEEIIENIDIGGPALLRSAAKNFSFVTVLTDTQQYPIFMKEMQDRGGAPTLEFRRNCAQRVFEKVAAYDSAIAQYFQKSEGSLPSFLNYSLEKKWDMRYGENPHQDANFYLPTLKFGKSILENVLQGKQLSYNNLLDTHAALDLIADLDRKDYFTAIFKHTNPCGVGLSSKSLLESYQRAKSGDPISAFGGVVIFSSSVDVKTAEACNELFTEIVIAPGFSPDAMKVFSSKKNLRLLQVDYSRLDLCMSGHDIRRAADGYLIQQRDRSVENLSQFKVVTKRSPTTEEVEALTLAWQVAKHVKSNAIVISNATHTLGIGAGQMSRVDSSKIASLKAAEKKSPLLALASDAFFPFRDSVDEAGEFGVTAIVQPGGSVRDAEVIEAANERNMAMIFTGIRHFRH